MSGAGARAERDSERERRTARLGLLSDVVWRTTEFFHDEGFTQLLPVMLGRSTDPLGPDPGSSVLTTVEFDYLGQRFYLMNSMILHKQVAVRDVGKIWILSPNVRLERPERRASRKHLFEFTQADFEIPNSTAADVRALVERFFSRIGGALREHPSFGQLGVEPPEFRPPWKVYTTHELEARYGADWEESASRDHDQPFWAVCHRREFYDREDPGEPGHFRNYDLVYPGGFGEALSGAEREWEPERIRSRIARDGIPHAAFRAYLEQSEGLISSAGAGFGIERLTRFLLQSDHVGDVQLFRRVPGEPAAL
ncbi:MAG TPA: asparagine synthetase A [Thermoplasmata archaeon]|nr:asparagine synthetase A [Thermoplasmata archaeon]